MPIDATSAAEAREVLIVTGLSGAGNSTAIRGLEDLGFEVIDNLPLSFLHRVAATTDDVDPARGLVVGIDCRTRGFSAEALIGAVEALRHASRAAARLIFLDCDDDVLIDRFKSTRRRHPSAPAEAAEVGVAREREIMAPLRDRADLVVDTTHLSPHDLKGRLTEAFRADGAPGLAISIQSFSFKRGAPREADMVLDCRFLRNPYWEALLRPLDGRDHAVVAHVAADPLFDPFYDRLVDMTLLLLPAYRNEGKSYFCIGLGCTGGRHRSVAVAEMLAKSLTDAGWRTTLRHRELEGRGSDAPAKGDSSGG